MNKCEHDECIHFEVCKYKNCEIYDCVFLEKRLPINKCDNCDLMFKEKTKSIPYDVSEVTDYSAYPTVSEVKDD